MKHLGSLAWIAYLYLSFCTRCCPELPALCLLQNSKCRFPGLENFLSSSFLSKGRLAPFLAQRSQVIPPSLPFLYLTGSFLQFHAMVFFSLHMDMAEENFSLSQQYLQAALSQRFWDVRLASGTPAHSPPGFSLIPSWKYKKLHLRLCQRAKTGKNNSCFFAAFLFLYFPKAATALFVTAQHWQLLF